MVERGVGVRLATAADTRAVGRLLYDVTTEFDTPKPSHLGQGPWPRWGALRRARDRQPDAVPPQGVGRR